MGLSFDRLRCEVFQNLILCPMNTGFVRPTIAIVPTVYGIETSEHFVVEHLLMLMHCNSTYRLRY